MSYLCIKENALDRPLGFCSRSEIPTSTPIRDIDGPIKAFKSHHNDSVIRDSISSWGTGSVVKLRQMTVWADGGNGQRYHRS